MRLDRYTQIDRDRRQSLRPSRQILVGGVRERLECLASLLVFRIQLQYAPEILDRPVLLVDEQPERGAMDVRGGQLRIQTQSSINSCHRGLVTAPLHAFGERQLRVSHGIGVVAKLLSQDANGQSRLLPR